MTIQEPKPSLRVHHLAVKVRDLALAEAFYAGALGLAVTRRQVDELGAPRSIWLSLGEGAFLAVERADTGEPQRDDGSPGWHCIALGIDAADRETWRKRLTERGHAIVRETAYTLYVRDPEGAIIALSHYPHALAEAVAQPGETGDPSAPPEAPSAIDAGPDTAHDPRASAGVTSRLAALVTLSVALLALVLSSATGALAQHSARGRRPADALLVGSSSVFGPLGVELERHFESAGLRVSRISHRSTGFARPDFFDWQEQIPELGPLGEVRGVVVAIGGNDAMALRLRRSESADRGDASWVQWSDAARWSQIYTSRVRAFVDGLCEAGARRVIVVPPADGEREGWSDRIHRVQEAQIAATRASRCGVVIDSRVREVRAGDTTDGVHLGARASRDLVARIGPAILEALGG